MVGAWLSGRALATQARGVLDSATASLFTFLYFRLITSKFLYYSLTLNAVLLAQAHNVLSQKFWSGENFAWWIKLLEIGPRQCDLQGYWSACEVMVQAQIDTFV